MSSFLAPSCFTYPLFYFLAKVIPPAGAADWAGLVIFLPSCMLPFDACEVEEAPAAEELTGTEIAWNVA